MGMRQNIKLVYIPQDIEKTITEKAIYIYSHWGGGFEYRDSSLADAIVRALGKHERWDDPEYLARMIFSEVVKEDVNGNTGFGLAPYEMDSNFNTIEIDLQGKMIDGWTYQQFIDGYLDFENPERED